MLVWPMGVDCYNAVPIQIGRNATVSQRAFLCTSGHNIIDPHHHQIDAPIVIEDTGMGMC